MAILEFDREHEDYDKCHRVLRSCRSMEHAVTANTMVHLYGRSYGKTYRWKELDLVAMSILYYLTDREDLDRYQENNEELSILDKGRNMWFKRYL